ncbi:N-acetyltransferase [Vibrio hannami]|nr:N-acetyltransferase [Vibrio hannami]MDG3088210.1 N-acetyltransferase [Vibrio hannami]
MISYLKDAGWPTDPNAIHERVMLDFNYAHIVEVGGVSAGLFKFKYLEELNQWYVVQIQIHSDFQGRKIGSRLLLELIAKAKENGASVALGVLKTNPAQNLYYRLGFEKVGETDAEYNLEYHNCNSVIENG